MTKTTTVASKAFVAVVAAAMVFSLVAPAAKAATAEELQAQIAALMAQITALQGGTTTTPAAPAAGAYTFTRALTLGSTGADVTALQNYLISKGHAIAAGATGYFGAQTAAAVAAWQTANGITPAAGYFGPVSQAKYMALMASTPTTPTTPGDEDDEDDTDSAELSGEASLDTLDIDSASDDTVEEGAEEAEIAEVTVEFADGDAEISRMDVTLDGVADVWDVLETVSVWVDGDMVAEMTADDEDEYLDTTGTAGTLRFSGLDIVAMEDEEVVITIAATIQGNVDGADQGNYTVAVDTLRFFDADGVATTEDTGTSNIDLGDTVTFTIEAAGAEDEVIVKTSSEDPDDTTLQVEDDKKSDWYTVFAFDLDTDDSTNDIELNTVVVTVDAGAAASYNTLVDDAELVIDGVTIDDVTVTGDNAVDGGVATLTFDVDGDATIDAGERVVAELKLRFKSLASADEGVTIAAAAAGSDVDAEGADDVTGSGSATGGTHTLRTTGINVEVDSTSADTTDVDGADNDYATYEITLDVTAFEQDVFVPVNAASTSWKFVDGNGADLTVPTASTTVVIDSSAEEGGAGDAFFEINEGETETVTITVTFTPGATTPIAARLQLVSLTFDASGTTSSAGDQTWSALPANDYRTSVVTVQN